MSLDDFEELLADKPADEKWELIGGRVVRMMVGARWEHHFIARNLAFGLMQRLRAKGSSCQVFQETFFMKEKAIDSATLPDVMVRCGAMEPGATSVNDPTVLVEVMSEGSKARDRFEKWAVYQRLPSLRHYVLVERDRPHIETFDRIGEAWSGVQILDGLEAELNLPAIGVSLPLAEIYRDVISM
jgi:Uma2 family endonuclease